jgi:hypothetical protein
MSRAWRGGSTSRWRKVRAQILAENLAATGGACQAAVPGVCTGQQEQVHHVLGRAVSGDDRRYLMPVCAACNRAIGEPGKRLPQHKTVTKW